MVRASWWWVIGWWAASAASPVEEEEAAAAASADWKYSLWQRGIHEFACDASDDGSCALTWARRARYARHLPVLRHRGGGGAAAEPGRTAVDYDALKARLGSRFAAALDENEREHAEDCRASCELFYCGAAAPDAPEVAVRSISMGSVPPEDFATDFRFPLDLIKVSQEPLFPADEAQAAIELARTENVDINEYTSGKYKLGGDWLKKMPKTRAWFNSRLESTIFPAIARSFPEVVTSAGTLRAHSVAMLKYNATHPRTDVHIDNGVLALTLALSRAEAYEGGGTFFEHLGEGNLVAMDAGQATWRPGSVRHGGHRVTRGVRYIIGAFLLLEDRVEHVRRLKNRGSTLRTRGDVRGAVEHFEWALEINDRCATCLKDLSEAKTVLAEGVAGGGSGGAAAEALLDGAEADLRRALDLLPSDSDALFSLGVLLSKRGDGEGAVAAYERAAAVNADDVELLYNLGVKLGEAGQRGDDERRMYARALEADPTYAKAHTNLGASFADAGDLDAAERHFSAAAVHDPANLAAWQNLALLLQQRGLAAVGGVQTASSRDAAVAAALAADAHFKGAEAAWRAVRGLPGAPADAVRRLATVLQLRGRSAAVANNLVAALAHFTEAKSLVPHDPLNWASLQKLYELSGDAASAADAARNARILQAVPGP